MINYHNKTLAVLKSNCIPKVLEDCTYNELRIVRGQIRMCFSLEEDEVKDIVAMVNCEMKRRNK